MTTALTTAALTDFFGADSPILAQALSDKAKQADAKRRAMFATLTAAEHDAAVQLPKLEAAHAKAAERMAMLRAQLADATAANYDAETAKTIQSAAISHRLAAAKAELRATAPAAITEASAKLAALVEKVGTAPTVRLFDHEKQTGNARVVASNRAAVEVRLKAMHAAQFALGELAETYTPPDQLPAAIVAIINTIPGGWSESTPTEPLGNALTNAARSVA